MKLKTLLDNLDLPEEAAAQLREAFEKQARELELVHQASRHFTRTLDFDNVVSRVLSEVCELLGTVGSSLWLKDEKGTLICRAVSGPARDLVQGWMLEPGQGIAGWVVNHGTHVIVNDVREDERHFNGVNEKTQLGIRSLIAVPLKMQDRVTGVLQVVDTAVNRFSDEDLMLLEPLAASAAIALENAALYTKLEQANTAKNKFFSIIAHDLASPFANIIAYSELMTKGIETVSRERISAMSEELGRIVRSVENLLNNLLTWSSSQLGHINFMPCEVEPSAMVEAVLQLFHFQAADKQLSISNTISKTCRIYTDADMFESILRNFISNAVKFTPQSGEIRVFSRKHPDAVEICVADTGIGISSDRLDTLFSMHTIQATRGTKNERGSGIGLGLCSELAQRCNAELKVSSTEGSGSIFSIIFPLK
jgi:signal transduction histidine kinase